MYNAQLSFDLNPSKTQNVDPIRRNTGIYSAFGGDGL